MSLTLHHAPQANIDMSGITDAMLEEAFEDFKDKCDNAYYSEWFWYPGQKKCWINCWDNDGDQSKAVMSPDPLVKQYQEASTFLSAVANNTLFELLPPKFQIATLSTFAMFEAPERDDDHPSTTPLIEALHFRRGIHNIPCVDMEWEIPIPSLPSDPSKPGRFYIETILVPHHLCRYNLIFDNSRYSPFSFLFKSIIIILVIIV